jgi:hypothetical protein
VLAAQAHAVKNPARLALLLLLPLMAAVLQQKQRQEQPPTEWHTADAALV